MLASTRKNLFNRGRAATAITVLATGALLAYSLPVVEAARAATPYLANPASAVDPIIGTSGTVNDFPGAVVPFGMVQWSPDTPSRPSGGGYEYQDDAVTGFSLTHLSGPGCPAAGDIPVLPTAGPISGSPGDTTLPLDHAVEHAVAGKYTLTADGITTELTATTRSGMARFTFPKGQDSNLLFKLSGSATGTTSTHFQVISPTEVSGWVTSGHFCGAANEYDVYFNMAFDTPFTSNGTFDKDTAIHTGATSQNLALTPRLRSPTGSPPSSPAEQPLSPALSAEGSSAAQPPVSGVAGAYVTFDTSATKTVQAKVGVSYVSVAGARANRVAENPGWAFDKISKAAHAAWNRLLKKIEIGGGTASEQKVFETALYHTLLHPNVFSDANGQYPGFDGQVHTTPTGRVEYANISGWDIYRSQIQLAAMVAPVVISDVVRSMLDQYDQTGQLPKWGLNNGETYVMVGDPAAAIIADAYAFGARNFDTEHALAAMQVEANKPNDVRPGLSYYLDDGYLPLDGSYRCCNFYGQVSTQLEYNAADYAISSFARALGDNSTANTFAQRANNWQNVFNPATGHLQAKYADGRFTTGFTPSTSEGFVEGTSAQYTPMVPFNIAGLAAAAGGNDAWIRRLDDLTSRLKNPGPLKADLGNEPSMVIPWEYDYVGAPYKTQSVVREIQQEIFTATPAGMAGNDDLGTMSAWYVFSALGFYPATPGTSILALGSAVFPRAKVHLPSGKTLTITARNASAGNPYVSSMTVNGAKWTHAYLPSALVVNGGTVNQVLSSAPNTHFGAAAADAPPSDGTGLATSLGYALSSSKTVRPGGTGSITIGARNLQGRAQNVSWSISSTEGLAVTPSNGTLTLTPHGSVTRPVSVKAPAAGGRHLVNIAFRSETGAALPAVTVEVDVAAPGALWPFYNNAGIASDGVAGTANFDGHGWAYSAQQLAAAGASPGETLTVNGISFTMPATEPGDLDNIEAAGQTVPLRAVKASKIGFLGSAANASPGSTAKATVRFSDGSTELVELNLTDWTLGGGAGSAPSYGNRIAATTSYRNGAAGTRQDAKTYLFVAEATLPGNRTVTGVTLAAPSGAGQLHVFAIGTA